LKFADKIVLTGFLYGYLIKFLNLNLSYIL